MSELLSTNKKVPEMLRGQVGTIVEMLADGAAFEVEFSNRNGRTQCL